MANMGASESDSATSAEADRSNLDQVKGADVDRLIYLSLSCHSACIIQLRKSCSEVHSMLYRHYKVAGAVPEADTESALLWRLKRHLLCHCTCGPLLAAVLCVEWFR